MIDAEWWVEKGRAGPLCVYRAARVKIRGASMMHDSHSMDILVPTETERVPSHGKSTASGDQGEHNAGE